MIVVGCGEAGEAGEEPLPPPGAGAEGDTTDGPGAAPTREPGESPAVAGSAAPPPALPGSDDPVAAEPAEPTPTPAAVGYPDLRGTCPELDSGYPGDDACMAPPAPGEGLQIHVGPERYDDPAAVAPFLLGAGQETSQCWTYHTPNTEDVHYQGWTLSGRDGTHHIFNSMLTVDVEDGGRFRVCVDVGLGNSPSRLGSLPGAAKPYMPRAIIAPENTGLGQPLAARQQAEADMHYFNVTGGDLLREFWLNLYTLPADQVTETPHEVRGMGGLSWTVLPIPPGTDRVYQYSCPIDGDGRLLGMVGHYHAHGERLTAHIRRAAGGRDKIFEMRDYTDAAIFPFDSVTENPPFSDVADGAVSGPVELFAGDVLEWECHIINDSATGLTYTNNVQEGEMCNVFGTSVGPEINCLLP